MISRLCFALTLLAITFNANASGYLVPLGQGVEIKKVHAHRYGGITLWVDASQLSNPDFCDRLDKVHIKDDLPGYQTMVTMIMTAYTSKKKVGLWSSGCEIIPFWGGTKTSPIAVDLWITD
jgi:hypothetical protein